MAPTAPSTARRIRFWLLALFLVGIPVQFYLAGRGVFGAGTYDAHKSVGDAMHVVSLLVLGVYYLQIPTLLPEPLTIGRYELSADLPASGGLYPTANVT